MTTRTGRSLPRPSFVLEGHPGPDDLAGVRPSAVAGAYSVRTRPTWCGSASTVAVAPVRPGWSYAWSSVKRSHAGHARSLDGPHPRGGCAGPAPRSAHGTTTNNPKRALSALGSPLLAATTATAAAIPGRAAAPPPRTVSAWLPYWATQEAAYRDALLAHAETASVHQPLLVRDEVRDPRHRTARRGRTPHRRRAARGIQVVPTVMEQCCGPAPSRPSRPAPNAAPNTSRRCSPSSAAAPTTDSTSTTRPSHLPLKLGTAPYAPVTPPSSPTQCPPARALDKQCFVTVTPDAHHGPRLGTTASLGAVADRMRIMAYNLHHAEGRPDRSPPRSGTTRSRRPPPPKSRPPLEMGLPAYGAGTGVVGATAPTTSPGRTPRRCARRRSGRPTSSTPAPGPRTSRTRQGRPATPPGTRRSAAPLPTSPHRARTWCGTRCRGR